MGCGYLSPKPREGDIYLDVINSIFSEVGKKEYSVYQDLYQGILQNLTKRGLLKKLMDYLASHRDKITEAAGYAMRTAAQSKQLAIRTTGLAILDYIIKVVYNQPVSVLSVAIVKFSQDTILKSINLNTSDYQQSQKKKQLQSRPKSIWRMENQNIPSISQFSMPSILQSLVLAEVSSQKFQTIFLSLIHQLSQEGKLYSRVLQSLIHFCNLNSNKLANEQKVSEIMDILIDNIKTNEEIELSLQCYSTLLQKVKDSSKLKKMDYLKYFISLWAQAQTKSHSSKNISDQSSNVNIQSYCEVIISKWLQCAVSGSDFSSIYQIIIEFYDQKQFYQIEAMENMVIVITKNHDLRQQFFRGFFTALLSYLAFTTTEKARQRWTKLSFSKNYQSFKKKYQHSTTQATKENVMKTIKKWIFYEKLVSLNDVIRYSCGLFVHAYLFNVNYIQKNQFQRKVKHQFVVMCQSIGLNQKIIVINMMLQEYFWKDSSEGYRLELVQLIQQISKGQLISEQGQLLRFAWPLQQIPLDTKILYIKCIEELSNKMTSIYTFSNSEQFCKFFAIIFEELASEMIQIDKLYKYASSVVGLCQTMIRNNFKEIITAYLERIGRSLSEIKIDQNRFICTYLMVELSQSLKVAIPTSFEFKKIKESIQKKQYMPSFMQNYEDISFEQSQSYIATIILLIKDEKQYVVCKNYLKDMFKTGVTYIMSTEMEQNETAFVKQNSIVEQQIYGNSEASFHQIIQIINS